MTNDERRLKAKELIECLGMWNISLDDSRRIVSIMEARLAIITVMPNPLAGTNLRPVKEGETGMSQEELRQRIFHEPMDKDDEQLPLKGLN